MEKRAYVRGKVLGTTGSEFEGHISFELNKDTVYYTWRLQDLGGSFPAEKSQPISLRVIPKGEEPLAFALQHAVAGINTYRINRAQSFEVERYGWQE